MREGYGQGWWLMGRDRNIPAGTLLGSLHTKPDHLNHTQHNTTSHTQTHTHEYKHTHTRTHTHTHSHTVYHPYNFTFALSYYLVVIILNSLSKENKRSIYLNIYVYLGKDYAFNTKMALQRFALTDLKSALFHVSLMVF